MRVVKAGVMGFCGGVRRAFRIAVEAAERYGGLQSDGPVVHNPQVVEELLKRGVVVSPALDLPYPVLIRAHGAAPEQRRQWQARGLSIIDATCPYVAANQCLAETAAAQGERVVFAGDPDHAETRAVMGGVKDGLVVSIPDELLAVGVEEKAFLMAQTTFSRDLFREMGEVIERCRPLIRVEDTICSATRDRQEAARALAREVGGVVVVGGKESANTRRLAETVRNAGAVAFEVESGKELPLGEIGVFDAIGLTSGASTPDWVTEEIYEILSACC